MKPELNWSHGRRLLEFTPSSGAEIQSEYLMDRRHASAALEALRGLGHAKCALRLAQTASADPLSPSV